MTKNMSYQSDLAKIAELMSQRIADMKQADIMEGTAESPVIHSEEEYILFALEEVSENDGVNITLEKA